MKKRTVHRTVKVNFASTDPVQSAQTVVKVPVKLRPEAYAKLAKVAAELGITMEEMASRVASHLLQNQK